MIKRRSVCGDVASGRLVQQAAEVTPSLEEDMDMPRKCTIVGVKPLRVSQE
jgi:hypothetical protein